MTLITPNIIDLMINIKIKKAVSLTEAIRTGPAAKVLNNLMPSPKLTGLQSWKDQISRSHSEHLVRNGVHKIFVENNSLH